MMSTALHGPLGLELRILNFRVPEDWASSVHGSNPHEKLRAFLEQHGLWGEQFRYGCADSNFPTDRELRERGVAKSQLRPGGSVTLFTTHDSRDLYCNAGFFEGRTQIVVYSADSAERLRHLQGLRYVVMQPSALVAVVRPTMAP